MSNEKPNPILVPPALKVVPKAIKNNPDLKLDDQVNKNLSGTFLVKKAAYQSEGE